MAPQSKYNPEYHDDWAWSLASKGAIDDEISAAFGISVRTLHRWKKDYPTFAKALEYGKGIADAKVEKKLYEMATGYDYEETESIVEMDANGRQKPLKVKKTKKHVPPNVLAQMYWLNNRKPEYYRRNTDSIITQVEDENDIVQIYLPDNGRDGEQNG